MKVRHDVVIIVVDEEGDTVVMEGLLWMSPVKTLFETLLGTAMYCGIIKFVGVNFHGLPKIYRLVGT